MRYIIAIILALFMIGCYGNESQTPYSVNMMIRPIILVSRSKNNDVTILDKRGSILTYSSETTFAKSLESLAIGDTIAK